MIAEYAGTTNKAGLSMGVFFSFCFISFYGGGIDVVGYVYCCEYLSLLRSNPDESRFCPVKVVQ